MENRLNILLNGPSLKSYFDNVTYPIYGDILVTNNFANSELFHDLEISYYLFQDEYYWTNNPSNHFLKLRNRTFSQLSKVDKNMSLVLPSFITKSQRNFVSKETKVDKIDYVYYRHKLANFPLYRSIQNQNTIPNFLMKQNWLTPPPLNVLVGALLFAIQSNYSDVRIIGCDMGYFRNFEIDPENGQLCVTEKYHYGEVRSYLKVNKKIGADQMSVYDALKRELQVHRALNFLNIYAKSKKIRILNYNPISFVQCFEKVYQ